MAYGQGLKGWVRSKVTLCTSKNNSRTGLFTFSVPLANFFGADVVIVGHYPFRQSSEAHRCVETGHKRGDVVITVE